MNGDSQLYSVSLIFLAANQLLWLVFSSFSQGGFSSPDSSHDLLAAASNNCCLIFSEFFVVLCCVVVLVAMRESKFV